MFIVKQSVDHFIFWSDINVVIINAVIIICYYYDSFAAQLT